MEKQFRKVLDSLQEYKKSISFRNQIEKGNQNLLEMAIRQIQTIIVNKNQKIIAKILALRFTRDIMILGLEDVVRNVQKLVPHLIKICSHEYQSSDPERGSNYFINHSQYLNAIDQEQKQQIVTHGITFLILSLQSILHWAKWIPNDSQGRESVYQKAYNTLADRGVTFPTAFHYYKQSDTEKFKNMYKMQFFTDSYDSAYSQSQSHLTHQSDSRSQISHKIDQKLMKKQSNGSKLESKVRLVENIEVEPEKEEIQNLHNISSFMEYINKIKKSGKKPINPLKLINLKLQEMHQLSYLKKQDKKWIEQYLVNFGLLSNSKISYEQFLNRCLTQQIQLQGIHESISFQKEIKINQVKFSASKPIPESIVNNKQKNEQTNILGSQKINKKQQIQLKVKVNSLATQLQQKNNLITLLRLNAQKQKTKLVQQYESRILLIKSEVKKGKNERTELEQQLIKQNESLKARIEQMQNQQKNGSLNTSRDRQVQIQRNELLSRVKRLQIENQKLLQIKKSYERQRSQKTEVAQLLNNLKERQQIIQKLSIENKKLQKQIQNYFDQAGLYKTELISERSKNQQKINSIMKANQGLEIENRTTKQKNLELRKMLDIKQIESINLKEEIKRYQIKIRDLQEKKTFDIQNGSDFAKSKAFQSPERLMKSPNKQMKIESNKKQLRYNHYSDLYNELKPNNKELFLRLCRSSFKKKDILFKQNQLQVGVISEVIAQDKIRFILHFTNTSEKQIENLQIQNDSPQQISSTLNYQFDNKYIFCIQPQQQQKICINIKNTESPYLKQRAIIEINYQQFCKYSENLVYHIARAYFCLL